MCYFFKFDKTLNLLVLYINIYNAIYCNLLMKCNKIVKKKKKTEQVKNENEIKGNLPKVKRDLRKISPPTFCTNSHHYYHMHIHFDKEKIPAYHLFCWLA